MPAGRDGKKDDVRPFPGFRQRGLGHSGRAVLRLVGRESGLGRNILPVADLVCRARSRGRNAFDLAFEPSDWNRAGSSRNRPELLVGQPEHKAAAAKFELPVKRLVYLVVDQAAATPGGFPDAGRVPEGKALRKRLPAL